MRYMTPREVSANAPTSYKIVAIVCGVSETALYHSAREALDVYEVLYSENIEIVSVRRNATPISYDELCGFANREQRDVAGT
jgi:hypothetical protein